MAEQLAPFDDQERRPIRERGAACQARPSPSCSLQLARDEELIGDKGARRGALDAAARSEGASSPRTSHAPGTPGIPAPAALEIAESRYAADLGYPDRALLHARQAVKLDPDDSRAALVLSQALEPLGMNGLAGQIDLAAAARWPESPEILSAASYRLERLHREDDAIELLRREVALRDDLLGAHEALERLLLRRRDLDGALDQLSSIRRLIPSSPRSYVEEGKLLLANTTPTANGLRRTQAEQAFQTALALGPANAEVWGEIAAAELRDGDLKRGQAALTAALMLAPQASALRALAEGEELREDPFATGELQDLKTVAAATSPSPEA
jgi:tetratricopeptide (TPR) repeat protein